MQLAVFTERHLLSCRRGQTQGKEEAATGSRRRGILQRKQTQRARDYGLVERLRKAATFARLPQIAMLHQRRRWFLVRS
jgi:hypothetical protein